MKKTYLSTSLLSACSLLLASTAMAEGTFSLGLGAAYEQQLYKQHKDDKKWQATPFLHYEGELFYLNPSELGVKLMQSGSEDEGFWVNAFLGGGGEGYESKDSPFLKGMNKRKGSLDLGVEVGTYGTWGVTTFSLQHDVSGAYKGFLADANYSLPIEISDSVELSPFVGMQIASKKYVDYYYGVTNKEATASRKAYTGKSAVNPYLGYELTVGISDNLSLHHGTQWTKLSKNISDSSLVERKSSVSTSVGLIYSF
ncbi:MipA/OmpV family protein [Balneatrix alpica]|uniref:MipA/OmpV family protein n=1 Tax=Balneatrix alpica TaxID=75684 RepID=UPI0027399DE3|nr:MipA/OmpV family protein [Balneatrix alpica]